MTAHTILHTNFIMLQIMPIVLNYAFDANPFLRDATIMLNYAKLCQLCIMLRQCDYAEKQCWHNRAGPTFR